jgi:protein-S-isoprenylcysteine O-methyltransferase Ste14
VTRRSSLFVLARALVWGSGFVALLLVYVPAELLRRSGIRGPDSFGALQAVGAALVAAGVSLMVWCLLSFVFRGRGTAAPFDPPRALVVEGPYRWVRNPMYLGAMVSLLGAAVYYGSPWLLAYLAAFALWAHLFVVGYEEPHLRGTFGEDYAAYLGRVRRWLPGRPSGAEPGPR